MSTRFVWLAVLVVLLAAPGASWADDDDYARSGAYFGVGGFLAIETFQNSTAGDLGGGFDLHFGYRITDIFATELEFAYMDGFDYQPEPGTSVDAYTLMGVVKAHAPFGRIQPYGLLGVGYYRAVFTRPPGTIGGSTDHVDAAMKVGIGVDYYITRNIAVAPKFDYNFLMNRKMSLDYMAVGVQATYRF